MVTQAAKYFSILLPFFTVWLALVMEYVPASAQVPSEYKNYLFALPIFMVIAVGCYSLAALGIGVAQFNDCASAAESLKEEIKEAKADLARKGFKF